jgi:hypothetical protein
MLDRRLCKSPHSLILELINKKNVIRVKSCTYQRTSVAKVSNKLHALMRIATRRRKYTKFCAKLASTGVIDTSNNDHVINAPLG